MHPQDSTRTRDWLAGCALIAALVGTASAEYALARACGFTPWIAPCVPAALDVYVLRALHLRRDVGASVLAMIAVNAVSHLVTAGLLPVSVPVVVGVSAIAPLVLWRVHAVSRAPQPLDEPLADEQTAPAPDDAPAPELPAQARTEPQVHPALALVPECTSTECAPEYTEDELIRQVRAEYGECTPSLRELKTKYKIGQARAQRVRAALTEETA